MSGLRLKVGHCSSRCWHILDPERSDECIDFTMVNDVFFQITCQNNVSISNFEGGFRWKNEYPWCIIKDKILFMTLLKK
ncbi:Uncharacterized protein FWK35_00007445 [Aphis craccivora]|uniref:Uncharacterized protein n=1 Tax=Aphis craccivora TaxID=307492 RepID=A0A6G0Z5Y3_APHCR|nr:Uncharacterized protein FWK35_00007445 [Aphis craccivora]